MQVTKRNGDLAEFNISKIKNIISFCCKDLDVNPLELESKLQAKFKDKIKTSDIQAELVNTSMGLVSVENPDWVIVSGRLEMYDLLRQIGKNCGIDYNTPFIDIFNFMINNDYYDKEIKKYYDDNEINEIGKFINPDYDWLYPISSVKSLKKKYLIKNKKYIVELPQVATLVTCMFLNKNEDKNIRLKRIKDDYEAIASLKISLATPFKANLRKKDANLSSCFILEMDDSTKSITKGISDVAAISGAGGGVGVYLGRLRPSKSYIKNNPGGNNIVKWVKILNDTIVAWDQGGTRSGALTPSVDVWHKDILDFIEMRTENGGDVRLKCFDVFPQVILCSKFIEEVEKDGEFPLLDRTSVMDKLKIDPCNLKEFNDNYDKIKEAVINKKLYNCNMIKAKELWKRMLEVYIETGSIYLTHKDNINKANPWFVNDDYINSTNLCCESFSPAKPSKYIGKEYNNETNSYSEKWESGVTHTCNLVSLNVSKMNLDEIGKYAEQSVRMLDNAIDITTVPITEGDIMTKTNRTIGVGVMGLADYMAKNRFDYIKNQDEIEKVFETVAYYTLLSSTELAAERGSFKNFNNTYFKDGMYLGKNGEELDKQSVLGKDWSTLLETAKKGVRNGMLVAVAPNTSSSLVCGCSASYLPVFNKFNYENLSGLNVPVVPQFLKERFWYYKEITHIPAAEIIKLTDNITKWIDTGISMELVISPSKDSIKDISDAMLEGFKNNLKAIYYCRVIGDNNNEPEHCVSCAN